MQKRKRILLIVVFLVMAGLIFAELGHYALWDDESITALDAKGVMRTGDTSVLLDHGNLVAYRNGLVVLGFHDRALPPLPAYLTAVSFSLFGIDAWSARLPFALLGLGTVALILFGARRESWVFLWVLAAGLVGNVSLILFFRQCRYYAAAIFFSTAVAFVYWRWKPSPRTLAVMATLSVLLFASNFISYLALYACLMVDYAFWQRQEWRMTWRDGLILFGPQLILNGVIASIWNPLRTQFGTYEALNSLSDRLTLFFWYWRDMGCAEFFAIPILLLALGVGLVQRRQWLVRGCVAMGVYVAAMSFMSPEIIHNSVESEVRYLAPLLPLALVLQAGVLCALLEHRKALLVAATLVVFGTNLLNGGPFLSWGFRSTILSYLGELSLPQSEPYTPTARWINENVPTGASIWVQPYYMAYPLMFHAPQALYAWQLTWPPRPDFANLPRIHFMGEEPPDYLIGFGPAAAQMTQAMQNWNRQGVSYEQVATIHTFWEDCYRPELCWHRFETTPLLDPNSQAIYIFQRVAALPKK